MKAKASGALPLVKALCRALDDKKAEDVKVLDVSAQSSITDYLVLATGTSEPHLRALRIEIDRVLDETHTPVVGKETLQESGWIVVDAFDVMVHLFTAPVRARFHLENLWRDAEEIPMAKLLAAPIKRKAPAKRASPKRPRQKP